MSTYYNQNLSRLCAPQIDYKEDDKFFGLFYNPQLVEEASPSGFLTSRDTSPLRSENDPNFIALKSSPFARFLVYDHISADTSTTQINLHRKLGNLSVD